MTLRRMVMYGDLETYGDVWLRPMATYGDLEVCSQP